MWDQPKTTKLYLHPPLANRQITLWPDFKVISKAVVPLQGQQPDDFGLRFLFGEPFEAPDWLQSRWHIRDDGAPIPSLTYAWAELQIDLEAFCDTALQPMTYIKLTLSNPSPAACTARVGLMLRSGLDRLLIGMDGDYYASYRPQLGHWDMIANTWKIEGGLLSDGMHQVGINLPSGAATIWQMQEPGSYQVKNVMALQIALEGCARAELYLAMGVQPPAVSAEAYNQAKAQAEAFWRAQMLKIEHKPALPPTLVPMFNHLVSQSLQMLATTCAGEVWPRQGGRYDGVWPVEAMEWLRALDRLGLHEWTAKAYAFFRQRQIVDGEEAGRFMGANSPHWQNETGGVLFGLGAHLLYQHNPQVLQEWRGPILAAVAYIERLRSQTRDDPDALGYGLLPAGIGHDWQLKGQYWCFSDGIMYMGLQAVAEAFAALDDPDAPRLLAIASDYCACLKRTLSLLTIGQASREDIYLPNILGMAESYPPTGPYAGDGPSNLIRAGIIEPNSALFGRLERFWRRLGWMQHGLTDPMTECLMTQGYFADPWAGYTWYVSSSDLQWFKGWLARGEREKAAETLYAQMRYGMSKEYYMLERYAANDPTFCPWQPNASANGRLIEMLFDFYGER
ncbi:MAG: hypothetical protein LLG44_08905 [Chloroflexi bacterium]|nr:hypothetical protein [Chloroflexota bacterium]